MYGTSQAVASPTTGVKLHEQVPSPAPQLANS